MKKITLIVLFGALLFAYNGAAQQDAMFTKYMFNSLAYNPAFAGSPGYLSVRALYRDQWWGIEGSPHTQTVTAHMPFGEKVGLGISLGNDKIGATGSTSAYANYAYHIPFGKGKISLGLQGGVTNWRADWSVLKFKDPRVLDVSFNDLTPSRWLPNFGAGLFYYAQKYYVGFSVPHLINYDLRKFDQGEPTLTTASMARHYYLTAGATFDIFGPAVMFKPSLMIKSVGLFSEFSASPNNLNKVGAPIEFDIDASFLFYETLWVGASFRSAFQAESFGGKSSFDSADIWMSYYLNNGLRIGAAYDYTLTELQSFANGSFEVMLGYDFNFSSRRINTPRYF